LPEPFYRIHEEKGNALWKDDMPSEYIFPDELFFSSSEKKYLDRGAFDPYDIYMIGAEGTKLFLSTI